MKVFEMWIGSQNLVMEQALENPITHIMEWQLTLVGLSRVECALLLFHDFDLQKTFACDLHRIFWPNN